MSTLPAGDRDILTSLQPSDYLQLFGAVTTALGEADGLDEGCNGALRAICEGIHAGVGRLWLLAGNSESRDGNFHLGCAWPHDLAASPDQGLMREAITSGCSRWLITESSTIAGAELTLVAPVRGRNALIGACEFILPAASPGAPGRDLLQALEILARQLGAFIERLPAGRPVDQAEREQMQASLKESIEQLREAQLRYQALVEQIPVLTYIFTLGDMLKLTYISPQVQEWLGYTPEECLADTDWWSKVIHPDDLPGIIDTTSRFSGHPAKLSTEYRMIGKHGQVFWVHDDAKAALDEQGRVIFVQGTITDITKLKRAQDDMRISLDRERELNELKTRFITTVSHEFRTPLSRILSAAELIERYGEELTGEKRHRYVDQIRSSITFMADMLQEILLVGNYEAGLSDFTPLPIDLEQFCSELVQQTQMTLGKRCRLIFDARGDCMGARMDGRILKQIFSNLLSNAVRYSIQPDPTIEFTVECDRRQAVFHVTDHGIGIPVEDQPRIFEAFHRGSNASLIPGTGLGLVIVGRAVQAHHGEISCVSEVGKGTTFTVRIPLN
ncbi:MAG: ATP-binding protein [Chloroflexi bacterium]|nr:ATP-binding protein [Chloroflexota bacterium]MCL5273169.1 ATP-binding protein [Chloroflexota bacterium]